MLELTKWSQPKKFDFAISFLGSHRKPATPMMAIITGKRASWFR